MLIDDITIKVAAGYGGAGKTAFQKTKMSMGPTGGSGGAGGSVYAHGVSDLTKLNQFRFKKEVQAEHGGNGKSQHNDGSDGKDLVLEVPVGTVVHNQSTGKEKEITCVGERVLLARGGRGGRGNFLFRSATNTSPKEHESGTPGEEFEIRFELKLIADVGIIGLPNAGKSSLLNELTSARAKVANYPFTTLEPNLGVAFGVVLADIPGLIEGASAGKGLGLKFLRHIERTKVLFHCISAESADSVREYGIIRKELEEHNPSLLEKKEYVFLTKSDAVDERELQKKSAALKKLNERTIPISIHDAESLRLVFDILASIQKEKEV